jgi:hypothetical protein
MKRTYRKEILRAGKWIHPNAPKGILEVTTDYLKQLVDNFKVTPFVPVLRGHISNIEAEKNPSLILNKNINKLSLEGNKLFAEMEIDEKELDKYNDVSVSIDPEYVDKSTGKSIGAVLRHVAAVMNPYIKGMEGFTMLSENDKNILINLSEIQSMADEQTPTILEVELEETKVEETTVEPKEAEVEKVAEPEISEESKEEVAETPEAVETPAEVAEEVVETPAEVVEEVPAKDSEKTEVEASEEAVTQIKQLQEQLAQARLELSSREASDKYNVLLSEGRILPSQKEAFIALHENAKGTIELAEGTVSLSDMLVAMFHKNPVLLNLEEQGVNEVSAEVSEEDTIKSEFRQLPEHSKKSDEEFATFWEKYGKTAIEDYKKSKK